MVRTKEREHGEGKNTSRLAIVFCSLILFFLCVVGRLVKVQFFADKRLKSLAANQFQGIVKVQPKRGTIYDRDGNAVAVSIDMPSLYVRPHLISSRTKVVTELSKITGLSRKELMHKVRNSKPFVWITRQKPLLNLKDIHKLSREGIGVVKEGKRIYPYKELAANILGFVGIDGQGLEGIELQFDRYLRGEQSTIHSERDAFGRPISSTFALQSSVTSGHSLYLTINKTVQYVVEKELAKTIQAYEAQGGIVIVMVPQTGEILAMANHPAYDPNRFSDYSPVIRKNHAISDVFEPGSTMKIFIAAAALEYEIANRSSTFFCEEGEFHIGKRVIREAGGHRYGNLTLTEILKYSSNICAAKVALKIGRTRLYQQIKKFGFGEKIGMELLGETSGLLKPYEDWNDLSVSNIGFGQGISVSGLQMISAASALANGGILMRPYLVKQVVDLKGIPVKTFAPEIIRRVISEQTAKEVMDMMVRVTEEGGTGQRAIIEGIPVAGKTGTAQKPDTEHGGYLKDQYVSSFIGFAPANDPRIAALVVIDNPRKQYYASLVAAPLFKKIVENTIRVEKLPVFEGRQMPKAEREGGGNIRAEVPVLRTQNGRYVIPSLRGLTMKEVFALFRDAKVSLKLEGSGLAVSQNIPAGTEVMPGIALKVAFSDE